MNQHRTLMIPIAVSLTLLVPMAQAGIPAADVPQFNETICTDGALTENSWKHAARLPLSDFWAQASAPETGEVLVFSTPSALYVGFVFQDSDIRSEVRARDGKTYNDDCAEIFLGKPEPELKDSLGFEINSAGSISDFRYHHPQQFEYGWTASGIKTAIVQYPTLPDEVTHQTGAGWIVEMEIPWDWLCRELSQPSHPSRLRANFARWDQGSSGRVFTIWSNSFLTPPKPHQPDHYGWLNFQQSSFVHGNVATHDGLPWTNKPKNP